MTQSERLVFLIEYLKNEDGRYKQIDIPKETSKQKSLLRSLMNIRPAKPVSEEFTAVQDMYLQEELLCKGTVSLEDMSPVQPGIYIWQGDITRLSADAVVNAANSAMLGCFVPCHGCIDNAIHSAAGVQLRLECASIMGRQKRPEPAGRAKITKAYNLPCSYVIHTVGPIVSGTLTERECMQLAECYRSCLLLAAEYRLKSIAFCCISTGEFHFPAENAAEIAVRTVRGFLAENKDGMEVIFNVFKDRDREIYERLLR